VVAAALRRLGVDARIGAVPGEYCPGDHSVNARGQTKLMGVGQRIVRGAAHVGGVIVLADSARVREVLLPVYEALGFAWDPASVGSLADEIGAVSRKTVCEALLAELAERHTLEHAALPAALLEAAARSEAEHRL
jgi:lipoate-protein ligase A